MFTNHCPRVKVAISSAGVLASANPHTGYDWTSWTGSTAEHIACGLSNHDSFSSTDNGLLKYAGEATSITINTTLFWRSAAQ
jgi:hypothetical protein